MNAAANSGLALAADFGGTSMRAALVDRAGALLARASAATAPERGIDDAAERLLGLLAEVRERAGDRPLAGLGVATAGPVDPSTGEYRHPPNLPGWDGRTMRPALERALALPVVVGHDATLAAIAEARFGAAAPARDLVYLTVGTGIGAGIMANGEPLTGASGGAGEAGHLIVQPGGRPCGAGCPGCLEGAASGPAIAAEARRRIERGERSSLVAAAGGSAGAITADHVFECAAAGDAVASAVIAEAVRYFGAGIAGLLAIFDPEALVLGGGVAEGLRAHWDLLVDAVRTQALPRYAEQVPVAMTTLGGDASLLGAAVLAFDRADRDAGT